MAFALFFTFQQHLKFPPGVYILCFVSAGSQKYMSQVLPVLLDASKNRDPNLRQCAVFGLGVLAEHRPEGFQQIAATAVQTLLQIINASDSRSTLHIVPSTRA